MKKRLIEFLAYLDVGQNKFEKIVGLSMGYVNKVGDSIREANLAKISAVYPDLNINWLKTGEGEMLKSGSVQSARDIKVSGDNSGVVGHVGGNVDMGDRNFAEENKRLAAENTTLNEELRQLRTRNNELVDQILKLTTKLINQTN